MNDVAFAHTGHREFGIAHIQHLGHMNAGQGTAVGRYVVQEQLEITHNNKLTDPTTLDGAQFGYFHVPFVGCADTACGVDTERSFGLIWSGKRELEVVINIVDR
jgi:hypothetical protein